jgi:hypothetical protein
MKQFVADDELIRRFVLSVAVCLLRSVSEQLSQTELQSNSVIAS